MLNVSLLRCRIAAVLFAAIEAALLGGCESLTMSTSLGKKIDYKSSGSSPALEIPPDLTTPAYDDRYAASTASGAAAARAAGKPSEILPANAEARLVRAGSERWLVVKTTPEAAWNTLRDFWTQNGFVVAVEQPQLGIMETDWAENRAGSPQGALSKYLGKYLEFITDTYRRDKFRSRIERGVEPGTVEIYISHKGAAQVATKISQGAGEDYVWQPAPPNPELEAEFLSKLLVRFGSPAAAAATAAIARPDRKKQRRGESARRRRRLRSRLAPGGTRARPHRLHGRRSRPVQGPLLRALFQSRPRRQAEGLARQAAILEEQRQGQAGAVSRPRDAGRSSERRHGAGSRRRRGPHVQRRQDPRPAAGSAEVTAFSGA
jgi:uncharacterized lipoprotein